MQNPDSFGKPLRPSPRRDRLILWLTILLSVASLVVAGALGAAVRTGGTGLHFSFGTVQALASIVVNGVHYDDTHAEIVIDGAPHQPRSSLKLGMVVEVESELDYALGTGTALLVRANRTLLGQVEDINAASGELRVLAQRIAADSSTRVDGGATLSQLVIGDWVAVHGLDDPARNLFAATLIEPVAPPVPALSEIRGVVRNAHADRFRIGGLDVIAPAYRVGNDDFVAVKGRFNAGTNSLLATIVSVTPEVQTHEHAETEIEGFVADFRSHGDFTVAGIPIDASGARIFGGTANDLKPGVRITVEGVVRSGVLIAEEINFPATTVKSAVASETSVEVEGIVSEFRANGNFVVKGQLIDASSASVSNKSGHAPAVGLKAHIKGKRQADGRIKATRVEFEKP